MLGAPIKTLYTTAGNYDLDDFKDVEGQLAWTNSNNSYILNKPIEMQGRVRNLMFYNSSVILQFYQTQNNTGTYYRLYNNGKWYGWKQIYDTGLLTDSTNLSALASALKPYLDSL